MLAKGSHWPFTWKMLALRARMFPGVKSWPQIDTRPAGPRKRDARRASQRTRRVRVHRGMPFRASRVLMYIHTFSSIHAKYKSRAQIDAWDRREGHKPHSDAYFSIVGTPVRRNLSFWQKEESIITFTLPKREKRGIFYLEVDILARRISRRDYQIVILGSDLLLSRLLILRITNSC
jgi:hypothetical protein